MGRRPSPPGRSLPCTLDRLRVEYIVYPRTFLPKPQGVGARHPQLARPVQQVISLDLEQEAVLRNLEVLSRILQRCASCF